MTLKIKDKQGEVVFELKDDDNSPKETKKTCSSEECEDCEECECDKEGEE